MFLDLIFFFSQQHFFFCWTRTRYECRVYFVFARSASLWFNLNSVLFFLCPLILGTRHVFAVNFGGCVLPHHNAFSFSYFYCVSVFVFLPLEVVLTFSSPFHCSSPRPVYVFLICICTHFFIFFIYLVCIFIFYCLLRISYVLFVLCYCYFFSCV